MVDDVERASRQSLGVPEPPAPPARGLTSAQAAAGTRQAWEASQRRAQDPVTMWLVGAATEAVDRIREPMVRSRLKGDVSDAIRYLLKRMDAGQDYSFNAQQLQRLMETAREYGA